MPIGSPRTQHFVIDGKKICTGCRENKPVSQFYIVHSKRRENKPYSKCKLCCRAQYLVNKFNITDVQFSDIMNTTGSICQICGAQEKLCLDHNHSTGWVRGILCHNCNLALGNFKDDYRLMEKGITYLLRRLTPPKKPGYLEQYAGAH